MTEWVDESEVRNSPAPVVSLVQVLPTNPNEGLLLLCMQNADFHRAYCAFQARVIIHLANNGALSLNNSSDIYQFGEFYAESVAVALGLYLKDKNPGIGEIAAQFEEIFAESVWGAIDRYPGSRHQEVGAIANETFSRTQDAQAA